MLGKERIRLLIDRAPKLFFGELLGGKAFNEQCLNIIWCPFANWLGPREGPRSQLV
jgi:hypothetical protein